jgi:hypothetical protein
MTRVYGFDDEPNAGQESGEVDKNNEDEDIGGLESVEAVEGVEEDAASSEVGTMNEGHKLPSVEAAVRRSIDAVGSVEVVVSVEEEAASSVVDAKNEEQTLLSALGSVEVVSGAKKSWTSRTMDKMATGASRILTKTKSAIEFNFMSIKKKGSALTC